MWWRASSRVPRGARRRGFFIFRTPQGEQRCVDPFRVFRDLTTDENINLEQHAAASDVGEEPETTELVEHVCKVFGVERYDEETGKGYSDFEVLNLLGDFQRFLMEQKKTFESGSNSSPPTEPKSSGSSPTPPESTTEDSKQPCSPVASK